MFTGGGGGKKVGVGGRGGNISDPTAGFDGGRGGKSAVPVGVDGIVV